MNLPTGGSCASTFKLHPESRHFSPPLQPPLWPELPLSPLPGRCHHSLDDCISPSGVSLLLLLGVTVKAATVLTRFWSRSPPLLCPHSLSSASLASFLSLNLPPIFHLRAFALAVPSAWNTLPRDGHPAHSLTYLGLCSNSAFMTLLLKMAKQPSPRPPLCDSSWFTAALPTSQ